MITGSHDEKAVIRGISDKIPKQLERIALALEAIEAGTTRGAKALERLADDEEQLREGEQ